jgi:hypothetical protein
MSGRPRLFSEDDVLGAAARVLRRGGSKDTSEAIAREAGADGPVARAELVHEVRPV